MNILNNREIAIALWLIALSIYIFSSSKMAEVREAFKHLLSTFFVKTIMLSLGLMIIYVGLIVYAMAEIDLWNINQLKNTVFWCVFVGFMSFFNLEKIKNDKRFFKHAVTDNLKLLAIIQFVVGVYTFPLWVEIVLVPILALITMMIAIADTNKKHIQVKVILESCLILFGLILISYTLYMLITNFSEFGKKKTLYDFFVPTLLTLFHLPFVFILLLYSAYENVFIRLEFSIKNKLHRYLAKIYALFVFNVRINLLERWSFQVAKEGISSHSDLVDSFKYIFKVRKAEQNPNEVQSTKGWSPYKAQKFLLKEGLSTGFYDKNYGNEWFASSPMIELDENLLSDNVAYYIEGTESIANTLKIKLNVNDADRSDAALKKLLELANSLAIISTNKKLSKKMRNAILNRQDLFESYEGKEIAIIQEAWPNHKFGGYDVQFVISSSSKNAQS